MKGSISPSQKQQQLRRDVHLLVTCDARGATRPSPMNWRGFATLPQIETARVKPADRMTSNPRLSDGVISLMKDFSLSSVHGIGGAWGSPLRPPSPFDERYGRW